MKKHFLLLLLPFALFACTIAPSKNNSDLRLEATKLSAQIFDVSADQAWANTGIRVKKGEHLNIAYLSGTITDADSAVADADGSGYICGHADCCEPLPVVPRLALIGQVGEEIFYIGNGGDLQMPDSGHLFLRVNDCNMGLYDNDGHLSIIIIQ